MFCMNKIKLFFIIPILAVLFHLFPLNTANAEENPSRGITPIQVYSLWVNINSAIEYYAQRGDFSDETLVLVENVEAKKFTGKIPEDVFNLVGEVITSFSILTEHEVTSHGNSLENLEEEIFSVISPKDGSVTPTMVFLRSTILLDFIMQDIVHHNNNDDIIISPFYDINEYENKVPSDVYGLVEKALDRVNILVASKGSN